MSSFDLFRMEGHPLSSVRFGVTEYTIEKLTIYGQVCRTFGLGHQNMRGASCGKVSKSRTFLT